MITNVSTADGALLDYLVALAHGLDLPYTIPYSTEFMYGGAILYREGISTCISNAICSDDGTITFRCWVARTPKAVFDCDEGVEGQTLLIAAMRCFVISKLGAEVDVQFELDLQP